MCALFLAEGAGGTFDVDTMLSTASKIFSWVLGVVSDNPLMAAAFGMSILVPAGIMAFRNIKSAV